MLRRIATCEGGRWNEGISVFDMSRISAILRCMTHDSEPLRFFGKSQARPRRRTNVFQKRISLERGANSVLGNFLGFAECFQTEPRQRQGNSAANLRKILLQPIEAGLHFVALAFFAQCNQRPNGWNHQRLARDAVSHRISAVPSSARTHAIEKKRFAQSLAALCARREQFGRALTQRNQRKGSWLDPTRCPRRPAPAATGVIVVNDVFVLAKQAVDSAAPERAIFWPVAANPAEAGSGRIRSILRAYERPTSKGSGRRAGLLLRTCGPRAIGQLRLAQKFQAARNSTAFLLGKITTQQR